jgi:hypothetical protein
VTQGRSGPTRGQRVGTGRTVRIEWVATDPDGGLHSAAIDYSLDDGKHWKPVYAGPDAGTVALPSTLFAAAGRARLRVRVSDGHMKARE